MKTTAILGVAIWLAAIAAGFAWLASYETRPGAPGQSPHEWPEGSRLIHDDRAWTVVMFLHPHCPCSKASLQELSDLNSQFGSRLQTYIVFCIPRGVPEGWEQSATCRQASTILNVEVYRDENDEERRRFGAVTSGQIVVYDPHGKLRYSGGMTPARGKVGPNEGRSIVEALLNGTPIPVDKGAVFGCPLVESKPSDL